MADAPWKIIHADVRDGLAQLEDESVQCVVSSFPYWSLRDYSINPQLWDGKPDCPHEKWMELNSGDLCAGCGAWRGDFGLEPTPEDFYRHAVEVCRGIKRVLRKDGCFFLNMGDSWWGERSYEGAEEGTDGTFARQKKRLGAGLKKFKFPKTHAYLKPKDLVLQGPNLAIELQKDGWWVRMDNVWCLSSGTHLYARTPEGDGPVPIDGLVRRDPGEVELWNGDRWTSVKAWHRSSVREATFKLTLRSGERIRVTEGHGWPTVNRGLVRTDALCVGDVLCTTSLPEPVCPKRPEHIPDEFGWLVGLFLAEGSRSGTTLQFSGHTKEQEERLTKLTEWAKAYGGSAHAHAYGNTSTVNTEGTVLDALVSLYVTGKRAKTKRLRMSVWRRSNAFLSELLRGYLEGDGHYDADNERWRLGFTRNYGLESDLRTLCARLNARLKLKPTFSMCEGKRFPSFKGEIRFQSLKGHWNEKDAGEIVRITKEARKEFWDVEVVDDPHLFALGSGVLTHNSKPNPQRGAVFDRAIKGHEYVYLLAKSERFFYDPDAVRTKTGAHLLSVWTFPSGNFVSPIGEHFAAFPEELPRLCILGGTSEKGACVKCGSPWKRITELGEQDLEHQRACGGSATDGTYKGTARKKGYEKAGAQDPSKMKANILASMRERKTIGWEPTCKCGVAETRPCVVLDPFCGTGTTPATARLLGRGGIGIDVSPESVAISEDRVRTVFSKAKKPKKEDTGQASLFGDHATPRAMREPGYANVPGTVSGTYATCITCGEILKADHPNNGTGFCEPCHAKRVV